MESHNGCFRIQGQTLSWPSDFAVSGIEGSIHIIDASGSVVAVQGEVVELSGRALGIDDDASKSIRRSMPVDCHTRKLLDGGGLSTHGSTSLPDLILSDSRLHSGI